MSTDTVSLNHCFLTVDDHEKALGFYRDLVGLPVHTDVTMGDQRWLTLMVPGQPGLEVVVQSERCVPGMSQADATAMGDLLAKGYLPGLIFRVGDVDATFERLRAGGADVIQEPMDQPYGVRDCAFRDPAGNMVRFNAAPAA